MVSKAATTVAPVVEAQAPAEPKIRAARKVAPKVEEPVSAPGGEAGPAIVDTRQEVDSREIEKAAREADRERKKEEVEDFKLRHSHYFNMQTATVKRSTRLSSSKMPISSKHQRLRYRRRYPRDSSRSNCHHVRICSSTWGESFEDCRFADDLGWP